MLVLTRKTGEIITIDRDITVQIVQVRGQQVRVGISAPKDKKIQRGELLSPLKKSGNHLLMNERAAKTL